MTLMTSAVRPEDNWPPDEGQLISFKSGDGWSTGVLQEVRWGLVWRDFILEDGRVIPEIKVQGCPQPQPRRDISDVKDAERQVWEDRLASMAAAGQDPREREQSFRAELNQYLAYTYLRFQRAGQGPADPERRSDDFSRRIKELKEVVAGRLGELLQGSSQPSEWESVAHSLGRLKDLEVSLQMAGSKVR